MRTHAPACLCARDPGISNEFCTCGLFPPRKPELDENGEEYVKGILRRDTVSFPVKSCFISGCDYRSEKSVFCQRCGAPRPSGDVIGRSPIADVKQILEPDVSKTPANHPAAPQEMNDVDSYVKGVLRESRPFSVDLAFGRPDYNEIFRPFPLANNIRSCIMYFDDRRLFGVHWWDRRYSFTGMAQTEYSTDADGQVLASVIFKPVSALLDEKSEWWRRWGYAIVKRIPGWKRPGLHGDEITDR